MPETSGRSLVRSHNSLFIISITAFALYHAYGKGEVLSILRECVGTLRVGDVVTHTLFDSGLHIVLLVQNWLKQVGSGKNQTPIMEWYERPADRQCIRPDLFGASRL